VPQINNKNLGKLMKHLPFYSAVIVAVAIYFYLTGNFSETNTNAAKSNNLSVTTSVMPKQQNENHISKNIQSNIAESNTPVSTVEDSLTQTNADSNYLFSELCEKTEAGECRLRSDITIADTFFQNSNTLNSDSITIAITSENFSEVLNQFSRVTKNSEVLGMQSDFQGHFNKLYKEIDGLLQNELACTENLCAATFSLSNEAAFNDIVTKVDKVTFKPNAHLFSSSGYDKSGNFEARFIFSTTGQFTAISSN
jgi:hypothetical protein